MKEYNDIAQSIIKSDPVQSKIEEVVKKWSWKTDSGKPEFTDEGFEALREALRESGVEPSLLNEVSIFKDKYATTDFFRARPATGSPSLFMSDIEEKGLPKPEGLLQRVEDPDPGRDFIDVDASTGGSVKDNPIYIEDRAGKIYRVQWSNKSKLGSSFLPQSADPNAINWGADTYETAACAGFALQNQGENPEELISRVEAASTMDDVLEIRNTITSVLRDGSYDWNQSGASDIADKFESGDAPLTDLITFMSVAWGAWNWWNENVSSEIPTPQFIHGRINDYYAAEVSNNSVETSGDKPNTADFVVCSVDAGTLIDRLQGTEDEEESDPAVRAGAGICEFIDDENIKWAQVSHKKSIDQGGAQLGKFKSAFIDTFGLYDNEEVIDDMVLQESFFGDIKDTVKQGVEYASDAANSFINKVSGGVEKIKSLFNNMISSQLSKLTSAYQRVVNAFSNESVYDRALAEVIDNARRNPKIGTINEADAILLTERTRKEQLNEATNIWNDAVEENVQGEVYGGVYRRMNKWAVQIASKVENDPAYDKWGDNFVGKEGFTPNADIELTNTEVNRIFATHQALSALSKLIDNDESDVGEAEEVIRKFRNLQERMLFGRTTLPVWKVGSEDYKLMQRSEEHAEDSDTLDFLNYEENQDVPLVLFKINGQPSKAVWGTVVFAYASGYDDGAKEMTYTQVKLRSRGGDFDFTIEGTKSGVYLSDMKG